MSQACVVLCASVAHHHTGSKAVHCLLTTKLRLSIQTIVLGQTIHPAQGPVSWASVHYSPGSANEAPHPANRSLGQAFIHLSRPKPSEFIYRRVGKVYAGFHIYIPKDSALNSCKVFKVLILTLYTSFYDAKDTNNSFQMFTEQGFS